jgi:2-polyprenyl-3-methyl-5-hydroxy-6-metoxy-1,4-benzoquinol methylase
MRTLKLGPESRLLDYGCGLGRIAKVAIEASGCRVFGVDASSAMRSLAPEHVLSERFLTWSPETLDKMIANGFRVDAAMCNWVIQHAADPRQVIARLEAVLVPGGLLYVVNGNYRCVPTTHGYLHDGFDVQAALAETFEELERYAFPPGVTSDDIKNIAVLQVLRRHAG